MRVLCIRVGLIEARKPVELQAAADEGGGAGKWFSANLDLRTVLTAVSMLVTIIGCYFGLQGAIGRMEARLDGQQHQIDEAKLSAAAVNREQDERIQRLYARFNAEVVSRAEYQNNLQQVNDRLHELYTIQLGRGGR